MWYPTDPTRAKESPALDTHRRITYKHTRSPSGCVSAGSPHSGAPWLPACKRTAQLHGHSHCGQSLGGYSHTAGSCHLLLGGCRDSQWNTCRREESRPTHSALHQPEMHTPALPRRNCPLCQGNEERRWILGDLAMGSSVVPSV